MRSGLAVLVLFLLMSVPGFSGLIDFTGLTPGYGQSPISSATPKGTVVTNQYSGLGVLFSTSTSPAAAAYVSSHTYADSVTSSGGNFLVVNTLSAGIPPGTLTITFNGWVLGSTINFYWTDTEFATHPKTVVTEDVFGNTLETGSLTSLDATQIFTTGQVNRIVFTDTGGDGFALDTLNFGVVTVAEGGDAVVPEPGTLGLLGAGLAGLGLLFRRRRAG